MLHFLYAFLVITILSLTCVHDIESENQTVEFNPTRCAMLHNKIISILMSGPKGPYNRVDDFFTTYEYLGADHLRVYKSLLSDPLMEFLSQIKIARTEKYRDALSFTPHLMMPDPSLFFYFKDWDVEGRYPFAIQLYPEVTVEDKPQGGLFFDMATNLVAFIGTPGDWPHEDQWYPLEEALNKYLQLFDTGRYHVSNDSRSVATGSVGCTVEYFVEEDVKEALAQYEALIQSIAARLDGAVIHEKPLVSAELLTKLDMSGFPYQFLSRARTPSFSYIAPGVSLWGENTLDRGLLSEKSTPSNRPQSRADGLTVDVFPLFPGDMPLSNVHPSFANDSALLYNNITGVYLWGMGDLVKFILPYPVGSKGYILSGSSPLDARDWRYREVGNDVLYQHGRCPFFRDHLTRLRTLLQSWTTNVERGLFIVGPDGVEGGMELYEQSDTPLPPFDFDVGYCW